MPRSDQPSQHKRNHGTGNQREKGAPSHTSQTEEKHGRNNNHQKLKEQGQTPESAKGHSRGEGDA
jgi:hypothetical protein